MRDITYLIKNDWIKLFNVKMLFIMALVFPLIAFVNIEFYTIACMISSYAISYGIIAYDEMYKSDYFYFTLPVKRKSIVLAKYVNMLFFMVYITIIAKLSELVTKQNLDPMMIKLTILIACTFVGVMVPLLMIVGANKGKLYAMGLYILGFVVATGLQDILPDIRGLVVFLENPYASFLVACMIFIGSFFITMMLYEKKECKD